MFLIITLNNSLALTNISCKFSESNDITIVGQLYQCSVDEDPKITLYESALVTAVYGNHSNLKYNANVTGFYAISKIIHYFPQNLDSFIPNLKLICIWSCGLKEIHQNNLKNFPNLTYFDLISNKIEVIEEGLFDLNPKLEAVGLTDNPIVHIDSKVFDKLKNLRYLWLSEVPCINMNVNNSSEMVQEALKVMKYNCTNFEVMILKEELEQLNNEIRSLGLESIYERNANETNFGKNETDFYRKDEKLELKIEVFAQKYQNFDKTFKNSKFSNFRPLNYKYEELNKSLNCSNCSHIHSKIDILGNLSFLDSKVAAKFEDLKFSQCGMKKFLMETKRSQNNLRNSIQELKHKQVSTINGVMASSTELGKKLVQLQSSQNTINGALNLVKIKVNEIAKAQSSLKLSATNIEVMVNDLKVTQTGLLNHKVNEVKAGQNEVKNLLHSKLHEFKEIIGDLKTSIINELKPQDAENQDNLPQISLFFELTSKVDDLQISMTQLSQVQNDTFEILKNLSLGPSDQSFAKNASLDSIEELKTDLNATLESFQTFLDDIKATQEALVSSNERIQQSLDDLVAKFSERDFQFESSLSPYSTTQDYKINNHEDKFLIFEEKITQKIEQSTKEAEERLIKKFEEILGGKLGKLLDKKMENLGNLEQSDVENNV